MIIMTKSGDRFQLYLKPYDTNVKINFGDLNDIKRKGIRLNGNDITTIMFVARDRKLDP